MDNTVIAHIGNDVVVKETKNEKISYDILTNEELADYFSTEILNLRRNTIIWVSGLRSYGISIISMLYSMGYVDVTEENPTVKNMHTGTFKYVAEAKGNIYVIHIKRSKYSISIYNVNNLLLNLTDEDIVNTWGSEKFYDVMEIAKSLKAEDVKKAMDEKRIHDLHILVDAIYNGVKSLGGLSERHTPFTLSMVSSKIWRNTQGIMFKNSILSDCNNIKAPDGSSLADYIRRSYCGGWNYMNDITYEDYKNKYGRVYDVNSEYPFVMLTKPMPCGDPTAFYREIPENIKNNNKYYYYVRVKLRFKLKKGSFPYISKKDDFLYRIHGYMETSDIVYTDNKGVRRTTDKIIGMDGKVQKVFPEFVFSKTDYELIKRHYDIIEEEIIDGVYYRTTEYMFDAFINKYYEMNKVSRENGDKVGAMLAKMIMNSLSGTLGRRANYTNLIYCEDNNKIGTKTVINENKSACYIHIASAILSYGREYVYEAACANYDNFLYADTDSIHVLGDKVNGIRIDKNDIGAWKVEHEFYNARYFKTKAYVLKTKDQGYKITISGMEKNFCKLAEDIFNKEDLNPSVDIWKFTTDCYFRKYGPAEIISEVKPETDREDYTGLVRRPGEFYDLQHFMKDVAEAEDKTSILAYIQYPSGWTHCENFKIIYSMSWLTLNL